MSQLLIDNLFQQVLIDPCASGQADTLNIVTGYASPAMVFAHFSKLEEAGLDDIRINLIVGMVPKDGVSETAHRGFAALMREEYSECFSGRYIAAVPAVHSKIYIWSKGAVPVAAFSGSANYTQTGFGFFKDRQREVLNACNAAEGYGYFQSLLASTMECIDDRAADFVLERAPSKPRFKKPKAIPQADVQDSVVVSFISKRSGGDVPARSSLNWGQRPDVGREPNQAYIPISSKIYRSDFFPPIGTHFTVQTDDNRIFTCVRAQDNGKAIETPLSNSILGRYFRERLGLASGELVTRAHLEAYGRTDVVFQKIDDENFYMDFSV